MIRHTCSICNDNGLEAFMNGGEAFAGWQWQPFGPAPDALVFVTPGSFYRGFPAIFICTACKERIQAGETVEFKFRKTHYTFALPATRPVEYTQQEAK